ncbi:hypothetical protein DICVIV_08165 [Dictyocaulus viviparus]|uniref:Uncharacterized protein n=1 Tax=Dictyocaulus viviparus TaxID=29172 RepID=A0A0D8XPR0_DICVI|nr:hypothetical protein DICVIV_08165 [Dictyocaulus viviparus]
MCKEIEKTINVAKDAKFEGSRGSTNSFDDDSDSSDSYTSDSTTSITPSVVHSVSSPKELSYEQQEFIAISCCKQFLQQMVARKKGKPFITTGRSAVYVTSILAELFREHRSAYELMIADIIPLPTPDQREIPFSDDAEWVATRILAINRAQNRLIIPSFPPWAAMHRMWKVYGPVQQLASVIGGEFEKFVNECISVAYNHYYRLKNGIKVADRIPGDLLELCFAITSERMREHIESVEAAKSKSETKKKSSRIR